MKILIINGAEVLLDDWDWLRLCRYKWRIKDNGSGHKSIARNYRKKGKHYTVYMHRDIMNTPEGMECHHKNGNTFDNQTETLENLTKQEHMKKDRERKIEANNQPSV